MVPIQTALQPAAVSGDALGLQRRGDLLPQSHEPMLRGETDLILRYGVLETFEDQPLPLTQSVPGMRCTGAFGVRLSEEHAHSGRKSIVINGNSDPNHRGWSSQYPQSSFDQNAVYELDCWIRVEGNDTRASLAVELYWGNWHHHERFAKYETDAAETSGQWRKVSLTIDTAPHRFDPFFDLRFRVIGPGKAYFDDLYLRRRQR